jgi:hypothetical protein
MTKTTLPTDSQARKDVPLLSGLFRYFPAALAGVARWSKLGNDKHNPGEPLHHARGKSMDHGDCILRHTMDLEDFLADLARRAEVLTAAEVQAILDEADARAWRALADSQELHEKFGGAPLAPGARLPPPVAAIQTSYTPGAGGNGGGGGHSHAISAAMWSAGGSGGGFTKADWLCPSGACKRPKGHTGDCIV